MKLDISIGQYVAYHGYDCIIRDIDAEGVTLEYLEGEDEGEEFWIDQAELIEQNEDLIIEGDEDWL